ncbi:MAG: rhodanese-like domain-containing protein [Hymenobacteraceae bacterium]|nr:rhodanese-like domain-containing protein [Hymenobacteraceae bacterium]
MKRCLYHLLSAFLLLPAGCTNPADKAPTTVTAPPPTAASAAPGEPWTAAELLAPAALAAQLRGPGPAPVVFDMGPAGTIKGARPIGPAQEEASLVKLRTALAGLPKDQPVVVYCGCCPFAPCPNIRPAFRLLLAEGFTQARLLNLPHNLKADWIDAGYPMASSK